MNVAVRGAASLTRVFSPVSGTGWISLPDDQGDGGLKVLLVAHITSRRVKIDVTRQNGKSVTFEGHVANSREVEQIVREITAEEPPG